MIQTIFDWLCGLIITGDMYILIISVLLIVAVAIMFLWEE